MANKRNMAHVAYENFLKYEKQQNARNGQREDSLKAARSSSGLLAPKMKDAMRKRDTQMKAKQPIDSVMSIVQMIRNRGDV